MAKYRVLSLDGGGIRGLLTVLLLERLSREPGLAHAFDQVHLIAGTSSGGLIALAMAASGLRGETMVETLVKTRELFQDGRKMFGPGIPSWLGGGLIVAKYGNGARERELRKQVQDLRLKHLPRRVLVPTFDLDNDPEHDRDQARPRPRRWKPKLFHNFPGEGSDGEELVWRVAMATTASPAYFPPFDGYVDGGVFVNNPSMSALAQVLDPRYTPLARPSLDEIALLSVGAGFSPQFISKMSPKWGALHWGPKYVGLTLDATVGVADYECQQLLDSRYFRLQCEFKENEQISIDDFRKIERLRELACDFDIRECAEWLRTVWLPVAGRTLRLPEKTSKHLQATTELTLVIPIREGFVEALDTRTYATRLRIVGKVLTALREGSREKRLVRPLPDIVDTITGIHAFNLGILDSSSHLVLSVVFDGPWEPYMRIIWRDLGALIDLLLCNCADYEGHSSQDGFEAFAAYIRGHQVQSELFYAASPLSVTDVNYLTELERLQRTGSSDARIAGLLAPNPVNVASKAAAQHPFDLVEQGLLTLKALYGLRDLFPEKTADHVFLGRAAAAILKAFQEGKVPPETQPAFANELAWLRRVRGGTDDPDTRPRPKDHEIQGGILQPYRQVTHGCLLLLRVLDPVGGRKFVEQLRHVVTTHIPDPKQLPPEGISRNVAFTQAGLRVLGMPAAHLASFPKEFREGMEARAGLIGDVRVNHPEQWALPEWNVHPPAGSVPRVRLSTVDIVIDLRKMGDFSNGAWTWSETHPLDQEIAWIARSAADHGVQLLSVQSMRNHHKPKEEGGRVREHFGFIDGVSQPLAEAPPIAPKVVDHVVPLGELLVGHANARQDPPFTGDRLTSPLDNGTFLVVRKLQQHVTTFSEFLARAQKECPGVDIPTVIMGRSRDAVPLAGPEAPVERFNDFAYEDTDGSRCPLHAHIRRANPRVLPSERTLASTPTLAPRPLSPRIARRGMSYGPNPDDPSGEPRGMIFMAYNASIAEQFEVIQRWLSGGNSTGSFSGQPDPINGVPDGSERIYRFVHDGQVRRINLGNKPFVTVEWGAYLFVPSMAALKMIASNQYAPVPVPSPVPPPPLDPVELFLRTPKTAGEWAAVLEDVSFQRSGLTDAVYTRIREKHGGVFHTHTPYGVLVASEALVDEVLANDKAFSVSEYNVRMQNSIGEIYLGLDASDAYRAASKRPNEAIGEVDGEEAFTKAYDETESVLRQYGERAASLHAEQEARFLASPQSTDAPPPLSVSFPIDGLAVEVLARLSRHWLDIPDGEFVKAGGEPDAGDPSVRCPYHFLAPSRYIFSSPLVRPPVGAAGQDHGRRAREAVLRFVKAVHEGQAIVKGSISQALFEAIPNDPDALARALVGVLEGFLPTVFGNFVKTLNLWMTSDETLWRIQQDVLGSRAVSYETARQVIEPRLVRAMQMRPIPDMIYRTAKGRQKIGKLEVADGTRVVIGIVSVTNELLARGEANVYPVFGGNRDNPAGHPTHACPGYKMGMGVLLGMFAAVCKSGILVPESSTTLKVDLGRHVGIAAGGV